MTRYDAMWRDLRAGDKIISCGDGWCRVEREEAAPPVPPPPKGEMCQNCNALISSHKTYQVVNGRVIQFCAECKPAPAPDRPRHVLNEIRLTEAEARLAALEGDIEAIKDGLEKAGDALIARGYSLFDKAGLALRQAAKGGQAAQRKSGGQARPDTSTSGGGGS